MYTQVLFLKRIKFFAIFCFFTFFVFPTYAEFNPAENVRRELIRDSKFNNLKNDVLQYLTNSWCSAEKASLIMDLIYTEKPQVCVEIGVFTGSSFLPIAATLKYLNHGKAYAIEPWSNEAAIKNLSENDPNRIWWSQVNMNDVRSTFFKMLETWSLKSFSQVIAEPSSQAVSKLDSIDFIHFDGNFSEEGSLEDTLFYMPKVAQGGYILFSNALISFNNIHPKMEAFFSLFDSCEIIAELEHGNSFLLRKI